MSSGPIPPARDDPPWSCNGDLHAPDFGTLYAYPAHVGWSLYYDRAQRRFAFSTRADVGDEAVHGGRRWSVVRLTAADEQWLRRREAAASPPSDWTARFLDEARLRAGKSIEQREAEQLEAFQHGAVLGTIDQALEALAQGASSSNDLDARLNGEARDRLVELRALLQRLGAAHARLCAERDHAAAQDALADLEEDLAAERAAC